MRPKILAAYSLITIAAVLANIEIARSQATELFSQCTKVLQGNVYDKNRVINYSYQARKFKNWACESNFQTSRQMSDSSFALDIPLADIPIGINATGSDSQFQQSLHEWCNSADAQLYDETFRDKSSEIISSSMVNAFEKCVSISSSTLLNQFGVFAVATPENSFLDSFIVEVTFKPLGAGVNIITSVEGSVECYFNGEKIGLPFRTKQMTLAVTCKKPSGNSAQLSINTEASGRSQPVSLPGVDVPRIDELQGLYNRLAFRTAQLEARRIEYAYVDVPIAAGGAGRARASIPCPTPKSTVIAGGAYILTGVATIYQLESYPSDDKSKWNIEVLNVAGSQRGPATVRLHVACQMQ
ncbi:hypothetical protein [Mesorhizobium sp. M7A.F.Ca.US.010.02.1.1]|uniref:hypothetical protein n=1 Tax=Mesorhizobium sp. M7A.F.Ca.US.010.02.1.1 TaxID=2496743 RepID=UPI000FD1B0C7|nr:hypothetical protein [Mesorhizobium sp. M7A.F.Ca.US.010.02.1.1]RUW89164.1 hypothetical protein EOA19_26075 [Mesorhizobium sp. M7A.F.Ca.US.010.02.1.1]